MNQENRNLLKRNFNDWAIFSIINNTKLNDKAVIGWKIIAGKKVTVDVVFHIIRKFREEIVIRATNIKGRKILEDLTASGHKLNFYLPDDLVLFQTEVKQIERNGDLRIKIPTMVAQIDRRKDLRLFIENAMRASVEFVKESNSNRGLKQKFGKKFFDISAGGCSFIISKLERNFFNVNDDLQDLKICIDDKEIHCSAKIVNIFEEKPNTRNELIYQGWKVCLKHRPYSENGKKDIEDYIFRYTDFSDVI